MVANVLQKKKLRRYEIIKDTLSGVLIQDNLNRIVVKYGKLKNEVINL